jgi:hypothetical protein
MRLLIQRAGWLAAFGQLVGYGGLELMPGSFGLGLEQLGCFFRPECHRLLEHPMQRY